MYIGMKYYVAIKSKLIKHRFIYGDCKYLKGGVVTLRNGCFVNLDMTIFFQNPINFGILI